MHNGAWHGFELIVHSTVIGVVWNMGLSYCDAVYKDLMEMVMKMKKEKVIAGDRDTVDAVVFAAVAAKIAENGLDV